MPSLITTVLFLFGFVLPFGGPLLMALTPQPGLRLSQTGGERWLPVVVVLTAGASAAVGGASLAIIYLASFGLMTITLPRLLRRDWSVEVTVGSTTAIVAAAILVMALSISGPEEIWLSVRAGVDQMRAEALGVYRRSGLGPDLLRQLEDGSVRMIDLMLGFAPALFVAAIAGAVLLNLVLLRRSQLARGFVPVFGDLTRWKCPPELVWVLIASGYALFVAGGVLEALAANVFAVLLVVYFCQGLVIAQFYMRRWRSPFWIVGLVYLFIAVEWLFATAVTLLGVFDLWVDFRRLNPRPVEED